MTKVDGKSVVVEGDLTEQNSEFGEAFDKDTPKVIVRYADGLRTVVPKANVVEEEPSAAVSKHPAEPAHVKPAEPQAAPAYWPATHDKPAPVPSKTTTSSGPMGRKSHK